MTRAAIATLVLAAASMLAPAALAGSRGWEHVEFGLEHPCTGDLIDVVGTEFRTTHANAAGAVVASNAILRGTGTSVFGGWTYEIDRVVTNDPFLVVGTPSFVGMQLLSIRRSDGDSYFSMFVARYKRLPDGSLAVRVLASHATPCALPTRF